MKNTLKSQGKLRQLAIKEKFSKSVAVNVFHWGKLKQPAIEEKFSKPVPVHAFH